MSEVKLGQLVKSEAARDAVHVAVAPVVATVRMRPGCHVGLDEEGAAEISETRHCIGIVDPFLTEDVLPGQRFYLFLYPNTVTSLRHEWTHPAFPTPQYAEARAALDDRAFAERWLREYAVKMNYYDEPEAAFQRLLDGLRTHELFANGSDLHGLYELDDADNLKKHAEKYLGISINWGNFSFSCSC